MNADMNNTRLLVVTDVKDIRYYQTETTAEITTDQGYEFSFELTVVQLQLIHTLLHDKAASARHVSLYPEPYAPHMEDDEDYGQEDVYMTVQKIKGIMWVNSFSAVWLSQEDTFDDSDVLFVISADLLSSWLTELDLQVMKDNLSKEFFAEIHN